MSATFTLPVTSLVYDVSSTASFIIVSSSSTTTNNVGTVTSLNTSDLVQKGYGLWIDQELFKVTDIQTHPNGIKYSVLRGQGGSAATPHSSLAQVTIGSLDKFYSQDPKGRPQDTVLVSPWINTVNGSVWFPQGDSYPGSPTRWWENVTNTYGIGPLGVRFKESSPEYGT